MGSTFTTYNHLRKPEHRDPETYESWDAVMNDNLEIIDAVVGQRLYTEHNYIADSDTLAESLDKLDMQVKDSADLGITADQKAALVGEGTPNSTNKYVTKSYARMARKAVLFPEFMGATFTLSPGGANVGDLTTDKEDHGNYYYNHYKWVSDQVTLQSYDIVVQWRVPETFLNWIATANKALIIDFSTQENAITNNKVDVILSKDGTISTTSTLPNKVSTVATDWYSEREGNEIIKFDATDPVLSTISAGNTLNIVIRMYSMNSKTVKIGAITIQYVG